VESLACFERNWGESPDEATLQQFVGVVAAQLNEMPFVDSVRESAGMAALCAEIEQIVSKYFDTQIFHIGPLRLRPGWTQADVEAMRPRSVGTEGENTVSQLVHHGKTQVRCPNLSSDEPSFGSTLRGAVYYWMGEGGLDLFESHQAEVVDGLVQTFRMKLRGKAVERHLPEVGVGVSQVLPVVVQCLLAEPGSLILLQQPELHLHPALQQRLGNFLLACVRSGRQIVLETHSEYLVSRLALQVAKDPSDETRDLLAILLTQVGDNGTEYVSADIDRYGEIVWPKGFFDEGASEALQILQAGIRKQQQDTQS
jgi:predicted ATPase